MITSLAISGENSEDEKQDEDDENEDEDENIDKSKINNHIDSDQEIFDQED